MIGRGRMGGSQASGAGGICLCPECNYKKNHTRGQPCYKQKCPKCGAVLIRE